MITCGRCGTENAMDVNFCVQCGNPLSAACPNCGAPRVPGARFCGRCGTRLDGEASEAASPTPRSGPVAERRLVSVLFADLVGFTQSSQDADPEEVRQFLSRYFEASRRVVDRYGGTIEKFIGDAVMAVWGAPTAHEDDAERAVRAALDLVDVAPTLGGPGETPRIRAAVLTGDAAVTVGAEGQGMVAGDLVNTAARLQAAADPGTVLVGEATFRSSSDAIAYEEVGDKVLRGKSLPVPSWRAVRVVAQRGGAGRSDGLEAPFVGREAELRLLKDLVDATDREGRPRLASVVGQAGIGKSRLLRELLKHVDGLAGDVYWHEGRSPSYGEGITFWALGEMVRQRIGVAESDDDHSTRARLAAALTEYVSEPADRPWIERALLALLGLAPAPEGEREELFAAWRAFFEAVADRGPTVLAFEDLQWADAGLLDFIEYLLATTRARPILVIALARPELLERRPGWGTAVRATSLTRLEPLSEEVMRSLLDGLMPGIPNEVADRVVARAEGVPLYAVEIVRMLLADRRIAPTPEGYRLGGDLDAVALPATLHALIAARLDGLSASERTLLGAASVLGQTFAVPSLAAVVGESPDAIVPLLGALVTREFLVLDTDVRSPERGQYGFVQALVREVAYGTLSKADRRARHLAAAGYFEGRAEDELAGVVAAHFFAAVRLATDDDERRAVATQARRTLRAAAERASGLHSTDQALTYLDQALEVSPELADQAEMLERAAEIADAGGRLERADELLVRAVELREQLGDPAALARTVAARGHILLITSRVPEATQLLETAASRRGTLDLAEAATIDAELARAYMWLARPDDAIPIVERALQVAERGDLVALTVNLLLTKSWALAIQGRYWESSALGFGAIRIADSRGFLRERLRGRYNMIEGLRVDNPREGFRLGLEGIELAERFGHLDWIRSLVGNTAPLAVYLGEWDWIDTALEAHDSPEMNFQGRVSLLGAAGAVAGFRGDAALARRLFEPVARGADEPSAQDRLFHGVARSMLELASGDLEAATASATAAIAAYPGHVGVVDARIVVGRAALWGRDRAALDRVLVELETENSELRWTTANRLALRAGALALAGRANEAADAYTRAADILRGLGARFDLALALVEFVELLPDADAATEARREAWAIAEELRAVTLTDRLDAVGSAPSPDERRTIAATMQR